MSSLDKDNRKSLLFDAGPMLDSAKTGVGHYVKNIMTALSSENSEDFEYLGYYFNFLGRHRTPDTQPKNIALRQIRFFPSKLLSLCRRLGFQPNLGLLLPGSFDYAFFTNYIALPVSKKTHVTLFVYDMSFMDHPEFLQAANLKALKRFCPPSIQRAQTIVTISEFTKQRILHHFPETKAEIVITPIPPQTMSGQKRSINKRLKSLGIEDKKYFLYMGTLEPRKNIIQMIRGYSMLDTSLRSEYALVLAGGKGWKDSEILHEISLAKQKGLSVIQTGYVTDEEKDSLYSQSIGVIVPSHYEGFGMPILEAMSYEVPVAISDIPVFHEVAKDAALYFDKDSAQDIAEKMATLINSPDKRKELVRLGHKILADTDSWGKNSHKIIEAIKSK